MRIEFANLICVRNISLLRATILYTQGYSGSDISSVFTQLSSDAIMAAVTATHFKQVGGCFFPCASGERGSFKATIDELVLRG